MTGVRWLTKVVHPSEGLHPQRILKLIGLINNVFVFVAFRGSSSAEDTETDYATHFYRFTSPFRGSSSAEDTETGRAIVSRQKARPLQRVFIRRGY